MRFPFPSIALWIAIPLLASPLFSGAADWPHWRGPDRSAITTEPSGWETPHSWPPAKPAWQFNAGEGSSAPLLAGNDLYLIGWKNEKDTLRCLDPATGEVRWEQNYPAPQYGRHSVGDKRMYRGVTSTPEFDPASGLLFTLGCDGDLHCWDTADAGKKLWHLNLYDRFDIPRRPQITSRKNTLRDYGYTTSPIVFEDVVIVEAGDPKGGCLKAFDKRSGELRWESENRDPAGHSGGPTFIAPGGVPCLAVATSWNVLLTRLDGDHAGKTFAEYEWKTDFSNTIAGVAVSGNDLLISSRYNQMAMERLTIHPDGRVEKIWRNRYPTGVCTPLIHKGQIYFANRGVHCIDFATGEKIWIGGKIGDAGSCLLTSDERLLTWGNSGDLSLVEGFSRSPEKCLVLSEKRGILDDMAWPHLALAGGRLYCKTTNGDLTCFNLHQAP